MYHFVVLNLNWSIWNRKLYTFIAEEARFFSSTLRAEGEQMF